MVVVVERCWRKDGASFLSVLGDGGRREGEEKHERGGVEEKRSERGRAEE